MDNKKNIRIPLNPNSFNSRSLIFPFLISSGVFISGLVIIIGIHILIHQLPDSNVILGLLLLLIPVFFLLKKKCIFNSYLEISDGNISLLKEKDNLVIFSSPLNEVQVKIGYNKVIAARSISGYSAVIQIKPPDEKTIIIGYQDYHNHFSWGEDNLRTKTVDYSAGFPLPEYLVSGDNFMLLAGILVSTPALKQTSNSNR